MPGFALSRRHLLLASAGLALTGLTLTPAAFGQQRPSPDADAKPAPAPEAGMAAWIDVFGRPTASVSINGQGPFRFLVDTGATTTVIASRLAAVMGLAPAGVMTVYGGTGQAEAPQAFVDVLQTGAIQRKGLRVALLDRGSMDQWDGVLGADMFVGRRLEFDIPAKSVTLTESPTPRLLREPRPNFQLRNGALAQLDGEVGRIGAKLILDTGADCSIANPSLSRALLRAHKSQARDPNASVVGVTGERLSGEGIALPAVRMSNVLAEGAIAIALDAPIFRVWGLEREPALLVGVDLLSRLRRFSIDYRTRVFDAMPMARQVSEGGSAMG